MLDVHAAHHGIHGWRDFFIHLLTITIGLLIALSLEGWVNGIHRRHLLHEAEASLQTEVETNAKSLNNVSNAIHQHQVELAQDVDVLRQYIKTHNLPKGSELHVNFYSVDFESLSWKTAQSTGAVSEMSYSRAKQYAEIYSDQEDIERAQSQAQRDVVLCMAPMINVHGENDQPSVEEAVAMKQHIEVLQGQLLVLNSMVTSLGDTYKQFLVRH